MMEGPKPIDNDKGPSKPKKKSSKAKSSKKEISLNDSIMSIDHFQDGRPAHHSDSNDSFSSTMEINRVNHESKGYDMSSVEQQPMQGHYHGSGRLPEGMLNMPMQNYNPYINREQSTMNMTGSYDYNNRLSQYMSMRTNYNAAKPGMVGIQPGLLHSGMSHMVPPNGRVNIPSHMSHGPSPTLNNLLQGQNAHSMSNDYIDYHQSNKNDAMPTNQAQQAWTGHNQGVYATYGSASSLNGPYRNQMNVPKEMDRRLGYRNSNSPFIPQQISPNSKSQSQQPLGIRAPFSHGPNNQFSQNDDNGAKFVSSVIQDPTKSSSLDHDNSSGGPWSSTNNIPSSALVNNPSMRPLASPGSVGSRSNTPASVTGQAASPRSDGSNQNIGIQSPVNSHSPSPSHIQPSILNYGSHQSSNHPASRMSGSPIVPSGYAGSNMPPPGHISYNKSRGNQSSMPYNSPYLPQYQQGSVTRMYNGMPYHQQQTINRNYVPFHSYAGQHSTAPENSSFAQFNGPSGPVVSSSTPDVSEPNGQFAPSIQTSNGIYTTFNSESFSKTNAQPLPQNSFPVTVVSSTVSQQVYAQHPRMGEQTYLDHRNQFPNPPSSHPELYTNNSQTVGYCNSLPRHSPVSREDVASPCLTTSSSNHVYASSSTIGRPPSASSLMSAHYPVESNTNENAAARSCETAARSTDSAELKYNEEVRQMSDTRPTNSMGSLVSGSNAVIQSSFQNNLQTSSHATFTNSDVSKNYPPTQNNPYMGMRPNSFNNSGNFGNVQTDYPQQLPPYPGANMPQRQFKPYDPNDVSRMNINYTHYSLQQNLVNSGNQRFRNQPNCDRSNAAFSDQNFVHRPVYGHNKYQCPSPAVPPTVTSDLSALTDATNKIGCDLNSSSLGRDNIDYSNFPSNGRDAIPVTFSSGVSSTTVTQSISSPLACIAENSNSSSADTAPQNETFVCGPPLVHTSAVDTSERRPVKKDNLSFSPNNLQSPGYISGPGIFGRDDSEYLTGRPWLPNTSKSNSDISRLYEMGNEPERRYFMDKLIQYLEEHGTPITAMPSISKQPLDLYKLYLLVRERGGMVEVTRYKKWKEICSLVNISASASAAFTLKKNYIKYLFTYECQYDRGGMNPAPILAQMEAQLRQKRESKQRRDAGTSQDFTRGRSTPPSQGMDTYSNSSGGSMPPQYMGPGASQNMMSNQPAAHQMPQGMQFSSPNMMPSGNTYIAGSGPMMTPQGHMIGGGTISHSGSLNAHNSVPQPTSVRDNISVRDPFSDEAQPANHYSRYNSSMPNQIPPSFSMSQQQQMHASMASNSYPMPNYSLEQNRLPSGDQVTDHLPQSICSSAESGRNSVDNFRSSQASFVNSTPPHQDSVNMYPVQQSCDNNSYSVRYDNHVGAKPSDDVAPSPYNNHLPNYQKPPVDQYPQGSQTLPPYPQPHNAATYNLKQRQMFSQDQPSPAKVDVYHMSSDATRDACWSPPRTSRHPPNTPMTCNFPRRRFSPQRTERNFVSPLKNRRTATVPGAPDGLPTKREIYFPPGSVESIQPVTIKRRKMISKDLGSTDPWRLMMALKSGLLAECTWALNVLTILLSDESSVTYFGLVHLPGLLDTLLDHYKRLLVEIFGHVDCFDEKLEDSCVPRNCDDEVDLDDSNVTIVTNTDNSDDLDMSCSGDQMPHLNHSVEDTKLNYNVMSRHGRPIKIELDTPVPCFLLPNLKTDLPKNNNTNTHIVPYFESMSTHAVMRKAFFKNQKYSPSEKDDIVSHKTAVDERSSELYHKIVNENKCHEFWSKVETQFNSLRCNRRFNFSNVKREKIKCEVESSCSHYTPLNLETKDKNSLLCSSQNNQEDVKLGPLCEVKSESTSIASSEKTSDCMKDDSANTEITENIDTDSPKLCVPKDDKSINGTAHIKKDIGQKYLLKQRQIIEEMDEDEAYERDSLALLLVSPSQIELANRCITISNCLRNLSFLPGNDIEMSKHVGLLGLLGKLLLLQHDHLPHLRRKRQFDRNDEATSGDDAVDLTHGQAEWWWVTMQEIRENTLVTLANIAARLNVSKFPEPICIRVLNGLLHWVVCPSACARDPLPTSSTLLTAQSLALESLCKLSVHSVNIDLLVNLPPFSRIVQLLTILVQLLSSSKPQLYQEFAIVLLASLVQSDSSISRIAALQKPCISLLIDFLESAEQTALQVANSHGVSALRDNPEVMGTSLDMLRRAAFTLVQLASNPDNCGLFARQESRVLALVMSQILDQHVAHLLSQVLYESSHHKSTINPASLYSVIFE